MLKHVSKVVQVFAILIGVSLVSGSGSVVIKKAERTIDISSQLIKVNAIITYENSDAKPISSILFSSDPEWKGDLSFIAAKVGNEALDVKPIEISSKPGVKHFSATLPKPLAQGQTVKVEVEKVYSHGLEPFPAEISQADKQLVRFVGNHYVFTPYPVQQQTTKVLLASANVESYTKLKPSQLTDTTITLGPYENVPEYSRSELVVHAENNSPFLAVTRLTRHIEVSHWGYISVEETVDVRHVGAKLRGSFSRFDYQREHNSGVSSVQQFKTSLPAAAQGVYYRDEIGNISTSRMRVLPDEVELELRPRFPLFGGWRTHYVIGYTVPVYEYLFRSGENYVLSMRLLDHVLDDMVVDELQVSVVLPEGASDVQLQTPYPVTRRPDSLLLTYLDITGRPVISVTKTNLVENHIQEFRIGYRFPVWMTVREPLMVVVAFLLLFLLVIIYVRLDFSISQEEGSAVREKVASLCDKVRAHHDTRCGLYQNMEDSIAKAKTSKDTGALQAIVKTLSAGLKSEAAAIAGLQEQIRADGAAETAERIAELQRQDKTLREHLTQHATIAERLLAGKLAKPPFVEQEAQLNRKKEEAVQRMEAVVASL
ncbi:dolichyl-diphosphooligosaccharide--protein glycosyltransferase subunit 1-like [Amphibalanus amphitrite]|uniref:dolichyl-diphosphooligosaccharide--protein glycosyltransferase subunit 1-like n=1 Tax=Amphibalanus amphitrite TaxID=1232801 RepID=UPI001C9299D4|nr:dolichyl-diphosphooligosaccharide--protein glycosyltransferase subunit 1-like [Amphibalanus amphitrite]